jgi:DnaJ family protein C protein 9
MEADPAVQIFGSEEYDLYGALGLEEGASADTIKKAYRKLALLYHPDKLSSKADAERETAREKFQQVGYAYAVLSNDDRKARYDATGRTDETLLGGDGNWDEYFKELWQGEVNASTIDDFFATYHGKSLLPTRHVV